MSAIFRLWVYSGVGAALFCGVLACKKKNVEQPCWKTKLPAILKEANAKSGTAKQKFMLSELLRRCPKPPPATTFVVNAHPSLSANPMPFSELNRQGRKQLQSKWNQACPGGKGKNLLFRNIFESRRASFFATCGKAASELFANNEVAGLSLYTGDLGLGILLHHLLRTSGVSPRISRSFVRQAYLHIHGMQGVSLLPTKTGTLWRNMPTVAIRTNDLLHEQKSICKLNKGSLMDACMSKGGASGFLVKPLQQRLVEGVVKQKKIAKFNKAFRFRGEFGLLVEPSATFKSLTRVALTVRHSGYSKLYLVVGRERVPFVGGPHMLPVSVQHPGLPMKGSPSHPSTLLLKLRPNGVNVMYQGKMLSPGCKKHVRRRSVKPTISMDTKGYDLPSIQRCLKIIKQSEPALKRLEIVAPREFPFRSLLPILDAVRGSQTSLIPLVVLGSSTL